MNVLTTATDASAMPVAAGMPSSRTRPDDCRVNKPCAAGVPPTTGALAIATPPLGRSAHDAAWPMDLQKESSGRFHWKVPEPYPKHWRSSRRRTWPGRLAAHLSDLDPALFGRCSLDGLANGLDSCALAEIRLPGAGRPAVE